MTTIIKNADIYTSDEKNPKANCIVFSGKEIDFVGDEADLDMEKYADADIRDIGGKCLMPGFRSLLRNPYCPVAGSEPVDSGCIVCIYSVCIGLLAFVSRTADTDIVIICRTCP